MSRFEFVASTLNVSNISMLGKLVLGQGQWNFSIISVEKRKLNNERLKSINSRKGSFE